MKNVSMYELYREKNECTLCATQKRYVWQNDWGIAPLDITVISYTYTT